MTDEKLSTGRSPAYPFASLDKMLGRIQAVYDMGVQDNAYPAGTFYKAWGYGAKSSGARQTMAALNHFGLVEYMGRGDERKIALTPLALSIVQDKRPNSIERDNAIKQAALTPAIHSKLYEKFPPPFPDNVFVEHYLVTDAGYNETASQALLKQYMRTIEFAHLDKPDSLSKSDSQESLKKDLTLDILSDFIIGDLIQGTVNDVDQFPEGATILGFSDDSKWVFHDYSSTAIEIKNIALLKKAETEVQSPPPMPSHLVNKPHESPTLTSKEAQNGFTVLSSGTFKDGAFEVRTSGKLTAKDVGRIIKMLTLQKGFLEDDEDDLRED
ncbi:MAG: hypothetical protein COA43_04625 [Robiginitomaculum sp.]|nr:MAG: hypothetical protein COA43_04625 [Robiginitomaculum sp.]